MCNITNYCCLTSNKQNFRIINNCDISFMNITDQGYLQSISRCDIAEPLVLIMFSLTKCYALHQDLVIFSWKRCFIPLCHHFCCSGSCFHLFNLYSFTCTDVQHHFHIWWHSRRLAVTRDKNCSLFRSTWIHRFVLYTLLDTFFF
jgi:hypothetical protein